MCTITKLLEEPFIIFLHFFLNALLALLQPLVLLLQRVELLLLSLLLLNCLNPRFLLVLEELIIDQEHAKLYDDIDVLTDHLQLLFLQIHLGDILELLPYQLLLYPAFLVFRLDRDLLLQEQLLKVL